MRLAKNFGLLTFPVFRVSRYFEVRNNSGIRAPVSKVRKFRKTYQKFSPKCLPKIFSKSIPEFSKNWLSLPKILVHFWKYGFKIDQNWPNMTQKMVKKLYRNFPLLPKLMDFPQTVENVPNYLVFYFHEMIGGTFSQNYSKTQNCYRNAWPY